MALRDGQKGKLFFADVASISGTCPCVGSINWSLDIIWISSDVLSSCHRIGL